MDPRPLVLVKLGGSVLTRKREPSKLRPKILQRLAREVSDVRAARVLLLHGAGSFGHPGAVRWGLASPPPTSAPGPGPRARGTAIVSAEVRRLHASVLAALLAAGARPFSVPASTYATNHSGELATLDTGPLERVLDRAMLPVTFGDVVPDQTWQFSILSADTIAVELARRLHPQRVLFVSDVPGVWEPTAPSSERFRRVIPDIGPETLDRILPGGSAPDVTGGIRGKIRAMISVAEAGADAALISGLSNGTVARAIEGEAVYGSWSRPASR